MGALRRVDIQQRRFPQIERAAPQTSFAGLGESISDIADVFSKIQAGADTAEYNRIVTQGRLDMGQAIKEQTIDIADPDDFIISSLDKINESRDKYLEAANPRIRENVSTQLDIALDRARQEIKIQSSIKRKDRAIGDFLTTEELLMKETIGADERTQRENYITYGDLVNEMTDANYLKAEQRTTKLIEFHRRVELGNLNSNT